MGMNLHDFTPLAERKTVSEIRGPEIDTAIEHQSRVGAFAEAYSHFRTNRSEDEAFNAVLNREREALHKLRADVLVKWDALPESLFAKTNGYDDDALTKASKSARVSLSTVRDVADKLGFIAIPYTYLDPRSFKDERAEMIGAIRGFQESLSPWFNAYVLCPVFHYSVKQHVDSEDDFPIYAGPTSVQAFMAINMSIPMFRQMSRQAKDAEERQRRTERRVDSLDRELTNLSARVEQLAKTVERQQAEIVRRAAVEARQEERLRSFESRFVPYEPMMFAVPKTTDIFGQANAIVGPCWGPDFEDIVVALRGFAKVEGQRNSMLCSAMSWRSKSQYTNRWCD